MKTLVLYCHPNPQSFNRAIFDTFTEALKKRELQMVTRDLYELKFDPILTLDDLISWKRKKPLADVAEEQKYVAWCRNMVLIYPVWWAGMPALMKG